MTSRPSTAAPILAVLAIVLLAEGCSFEPPLIHDREAWPRELENLIAASKLDASEVGKVEVVINGGDGWSCRLPRTDKSVALVTDRWLPISESEVADDARYYLNQYGPRRWRAFTVEPAARLYVHPQFNPQEDGNGTAYVGAVSKDWVVVFFYFNF
jgi:hypothetical protein